MKCHLCQCDTPLISEALGYCVDCIRTHFAEIEQDIKEVHILNRLRDRLPPEPPRSPEGQFCRICANECRIAPGGKGYCGLYQNLEGKLVSITSSRLKGIVHWYYDALPTNCCAAWVCPGCSNTGYPHFSYASGAEHGFKNLAVFYGACNFDCLFCQNWTYRRDLQHPVSSSVEDLVRAVDKRTSCICFFGGDPTPQVIYALRAARRALEEVAGNR